METKEFEKFISEDGERKSSVKAAEANARLKAYEDTGYLPEDIARLVQYAENLRMDVKTSKEKPVTAAQRRGECED